MQKPTILVVDDLPDNRLVMRALISQVCRKNEIIEAESAAQALSILSKTAVDVILADLMMPNMNGIEMCRSIKADEKITHIPVILITAHEITTRIKVEALEAGADDFISKPVNRAEFTARLRAMLRIKFSEDNLRMEKENLKYIADKKTKALFESRELMKLAMDGTGDSIWDWNLNTGDIYLDEKWANILGYKPEETNFDFEWWQTRLHPQSIPVFEKALNDYKEGRKKYYELEYRMQTKTGEWKWIWARGRYSGYDEKGQPCRITGTHRDITSRKEAEQEEKNIKMQLQHSQKLESIGTLAGGVAHEINNPLNGIMNYAQLIKDGLDQDNQLIEFADEIINETKRISEIVYNLLTFARLDKQEYSPARLSDIAHGVISLIKTIVRHDQIILEVNIPEDLPRLNCKTEKLRQVLMNLMTNARDALNEKYPGYDPDKVLRIYSKIFQKNGKKWIRTTVEDQGMGIDPEIKERIFDPFFTTKPQGRGSGLGLSISFGIVQAHQGELSVETSQENYTRFHLDLPLDNGFE